MDRITEQRAWVLSWKGPQSQQNVAKVGSPTCEQGSACKAPLWRNFPNHLQKLRALGNLSEVPVQSCCSVGHTQKHRRTAWASGDTLFMWGSTDCLECLWSRSSEVFQSQLDMDLDNWLKVALCEQGGWMREPSEVTSNPNHSVILKREPEFLDQISTLHNSKVLYRKEEYWPQNHYILKEGIKDLAANHLTV